MADTTYKISVILSAVDKMSQVINGATGKAHKALEKINNQLTFGNVLSTGLIIAGFATIIGAAEDSEIAVRRLNQVFKNTGETSGMAAKAAADYASALQLQIGIEDEAIMATQAKLVVFRKVSSETARMAGIFDRATAASYDLQATGFGDAATSAAKLGKLLNDPIKNFNALAKAGIVFTAAEQKKITALQQSGNLLEAQKLILSSIEGRVGGVASATASETTKMKLAWGEVQETLGKAFLPALQSVSNYLLSNLIPTIQLFIENNPILVKALGVVAAAFAALIVLTGLLNAVLAINPFMALALLAVVAVSLIIEYWDEIVQFFSDLWDSVVQIFTDFTDWLYDLWANYTPSGLIYSHWGEITDWFSTLWDGVVQIFTDFTNWLYNLWANYTPAGLIYSHWGEIVAWFTNLWENVKATFNAFVDYIFSLPERMWQAGVNMVNSLWDGMKSVWGDFMGWWDDAIQGVRDFLPFSPAKTGPLRDIHRIRLVETVAQNIRPAPIVNAMDNTMRQVRRAVPNLLPAAMVGGGTSPITPIAPGGGSNPSGFGNAGAGANAGSVLPSVTVPISITVQGNADPNALDNLLRQLRAIGPDIAKMVMRELEQMNRVKFETA